MKKNLRWIVFGILLILGAGGGIYYYQTSKNIMTTDDAQIEGNIYPVIPKVSGYLSSVPVMDNQDVLKGDLLAAIESRDYEIHVAQAKASMEAANASWLASLSQVQQYLSELDAAKSNYQKSANDLKRYRMLAEKDEISHQELEEAERLNASNLSKMNALERQIATTRAQVKLAEARVSEARASLDDAEFQLKDTRLLSPASGKVTKKSVQPGQWVQPGQSLMAIVPLNDIWVIANYKETQITLMHKGQEVIIRVDTYPGKKFHGVIDSIAPGTGARFSLLPPENATGNFVKVVQRVPVKILLNEKELNEHKEVVLRPGLNAVVSVNVSRS